MTETKEPRTAKPGTLLSQWWTLGAIALDERTTGRHMSVAWVIIDRFMQKHGSGRASLRYIEQATGLSRHTVIGACRELVDMGYFTRELGIGTRPTEYTPKWLVVHPSAPLSSGAPICTTGGEPLCTTSDISGAPICTESYLLSPADKPADIVSSTDVSAAPPFGLSADGAAGRKEDFERIWKAYGRLGNKAAARVAFEAIENPDIELIVARAASWAASAKPGQKRMPLEKWLAAEKYDEADRRVDVLAGNKTKNAKPEADEDLPPIPLWARGWPKNWPDGSYPVKIIGSEAHVDEYSAERAVILQFLMLGGDCVGEEREHVMWTQSSYSDHGEQGKAYLRAVMAAVNEQGPLDDTEILHDRLLRVTVAGDVIEYSALTEEEFHAAADLDRITNPDFAEAA